MLAAKKQKGSKAHERRQSLVRRTTPEEKEARRIHAKRRFKAVVRLVIANLYWLDDDAGEGLSDNVKKNVALLTRKKEKKSLLTLQEKTMLSKPSEERTDEERTHLNRIIGGLKCFRRYPPQVKSKLAGVTYFFYYGPGRVVIKQNDPGYALYFILFGEVVVTQNVWDPVVSEWVTLTLGNMVAGQMFGEVSLLHGISRTATITTLTDCEFLCLRKEDFDVVLKASVMAQWERIQSAMALFRYFDNWDEIAQRECCILARMREYASDETILGDGIGLNAYTYFIIKGRCQVVEHLYVETTLDGMGAKRYRLYDPEEARLRLREEHARKASEYWQRESVDMRKYSEQPRRDSDGSRKESVKTEEGTCEKQESCAVVATPSETTNLTERKESKTATASASVTISAPSERSKSITKVSSSKLSKRSSSQFRRFSVESVELPPNVTMHYMQCCFLNELGMFGIGENFTNRRIVALTPVTCLLIPRYWLWQRNKDYVWSKVQQYLNNHIPNTERIFKEFIDNRRWKAHRERLMLHILEYNNKINTNTIHNVPYSIRVQDDLEFEYKKPRPPRKKNSIIKGS